MLDDLIRPEQLEALAGPAAHKRGLGYFHEGRVEITVDGEDRLAGMVEGSEREAYRAWIQAEAGELRWDCTCPVGERGEFCKHLVALALARHAPGDEATSLQETAAGAKQKRRSKEDELRAFLERQDRSRLVDWLLEVARQDRAMREKLLLAARAGGPTSELKKLVTSVTRIHGFLDYRAMPNFASRMHEMIDALEDQPGATLMGLAEYAVERMHTVLEVCDDSDGYMGELLDRLAGLHVRAAAEARPEPMAFARALLGRQLDDEWNTWPGPESYRRVLGKTGLAEYARLAREIWDKLPARKPGDVEQVENRYRITHIMESLAKLSGEPETLVAIIEKDLSSPYAFLRIAEIYRDAGRSDEAMGWADRGLAAFPKNPDWRLQDFLVEEYFRRGRQDKAMAIAWAQFSEPDANSEDYKKFMERARRTADAESWQVRALNALREAARRRHAQFRPLYGPRPEQPDYTALVRALLWEGNLEAALAEANAGLCDAYTLIDLAKALARLRPEAAIPLYKRALDPIVNLKRNEAYAEGAQIMHAVRKLLRALRREQEFGDWLAEVRLAHKPKRNFMKLLDAI